MLGWKVITSHCSVHGVYEFTLLSLLLILQLCYCAESVTPEFVQLHFKTSCTCQLLLLPILKLLKPWDAAYYTTAMHFTQIVEKCPGAGWDSVNFAPSSCCVLDLVKEECWQHWCFQLVLWNQGFFAVSHIQLMSRCAGAGREHSQTDSQAGQQKYSIP